MHMADALVAPAVAATMYVCSGGVAGFSVKKVRLESDPKKSPVMGVMGAFVFAAQMINFTIPGTGSSGHLSRECRRLFSIRRRAMPLPAAMLMRWKLILRRSRRCSGLQTAIMRQHGCWMREHRRLCRR